ncbi:MAG TPA: putative oxidoreductase C-terminal domain-containing protein [Candidatus Latescibacteria bacterium]|jgi:predicted dehydrogenase|nr:putative oxidoreductase C-terminal domain-containing protein [Kiritimatiellia bacterium]HRU24394.1 putative oxidoreductase C-terminal domain-containing protein [Candidatus Latescibacterota bacterium]HOR98052.1 putative oxidoreductase C-terminal domain-containing protein [Kiritimatiellia bacterium]HPC49087.1 putative oxidoreductase C-terminal domain-containing protein [Kiritimatiellia bacterium]HPK38149.1 putative oxidoreductase C-terminal domain-containing protein [Kiritimatiellia bacterium]
MNRNTLLLTGAALLALTGCDNPGTRCCPNTCGGDTVKLITLDPGHFHAALVQKRMFPGVSPKVHVYAPAGPDLSLHLDRIRGFNTRAEDPTSWESVVYTGPDFFDRMIAERAGNVVVLAGNNARKTEYILKSVQAGFHVLADKPMAITPKDYELLKQAFEVARSKGVLLYDIMTERFEITSVLQRELSRFPTVYGEQEKGTPDDPAVTKESVHHFCKQVAGKPLQRPPWYYDTTQQGEAIVDVNTHLTDLIQWETFPGVALTPADIKVLKARVWPTPITLEQFKTSTSQTAWPDYLKKDLDAQGVLQCRANGEFTYVIRGVHAKASVLWNFQPPAGAGDTHYSLMRGTRSSLIIQQGEAEGYKPVLYVEPRRVAGVNKEELGRALTDAVATLAKTYPGISAEPHETGWRIIVPEQYAVGHEAHFGQVMEAFLGFLQNRDMPDWEVPNMLVKYHTLMEAYRLSR